MRNLMGLVLGLFLVTQASAGNFKLESTGFVDGQTIPAQYTCNTRNISPELHWSNAPANTQAFAIIGSGLDSPMGTVYGWLLYNIPATVTALPEAVKNLPDGTLIGKNTLGESGYRGPCPPDSKLHHYVFTIYALNAKLDLDSDANGPTVLSEVNARTIAKAELKVKFSH